MSNRNLILSLAKVLISAAWTDGSVDHAELNSLKDLLFGLEEMTASDWAELEIYLANPIGPGERERLLEDLKHNLRSRKDKQLALKMLKQLIHADGDSTPEEQQIAAEIESSIIEADTGIFGQFGKLITGPLSRRETRLQSVPDREQYLDDFLRNRIYYHLRRLTDRGEIDLDLPERELRKLSLAGGLLARVATADRELTSEEQRAIVQALHNRWDLSPAVCQSIADLAISQIETGLDFFRLSREFFEATSRPERKRFVEALFQIGYSDGELSHEENEEIRRIAKGLKLSHREFIDAKLLSKPDDLSER
ncbi:MAG: TerB family tellurite resistance protein [Anaerolineales bacterium]|nr:TerB family tellurite resistance protein [Anaerolineales bacterium]